MKKKLFKRFSVDDLIKIHKEKRENLIKSAATGMGQKKLSQFKTGYGEKYPYYINSLGYNNGKKK